MGSQFSTLAMLSRLLILGSLVVPWMIALRVGLDRPVFLAKSAAFTPFSSISCWSLLLKEDINFTTSLDSINILNYAPPMVSFVFIDWLVCSY